MFELVLRHAENVAYQKALGYPSLIYGIITTQKPNLMTLVDILGPLTAELRISHKLYGHHLQDVPSKKKTPSQARKLKGKVSKTISKSKRITASSS